MRDSEIPKQAGNTIPSARRVIMPPLSLLPPPQLLLSAVSFLC